MPKVSLVCPVCTKPFDVYPAHLNRDPLTQVCSRACRKNKPRARTGYIANSNDAIVAMFQAGYRATEDGRILDPAGAEVNVYAHPHTRYLQFSGKRCRAPIPVHRFVAYQLHGEVALKAECVRHVDDNRSDNSFGNITYGTRRQNAMDIPPEKRRIMGMRRNRGKRRFTDEQVREIRAKRAEGWSLTRLQGAFGGGFGSIANVINGVTYQDVA